MYAIDATINIKVTDRTGEWTSVRQIPTFYLDENVQGIKDADHANLVATSIISLFVPDSERQNVTIHAYAVKV